MQSEDLHISDQDLLLAADDDLPARRARQVRTHLAVCSACHRRQQELHRAIADFVQARSNATPSLPPPQSARARLNLRMAELADSQRPDPWQHIARRVFEWRLQALACGVMMLAAFGVFYLRSPTLTDEAWTTTHDEARATPDPSLTPGATLPLKRENICSDRAANASRVVPTSVARQVFAAYGIREPKPLAYELDYLITPALGGSDNIRNFWPQPYGTTWNAHIKDALEDQLYQLVCEGRLDLTIAQRDISRDWVAAYKKYFRTDKPLPEHFHFLKDRPWG